MKMGVGEESTLMTMKSQTQIRHASSIRRRPLKNERLSLEDYIHLLHSRQTLHLNMNHLNQIIRIHGFKKIHRAPKNVLMDAVDKLDLVDLPRSTLRQSVSAFAALTLEDAVADLSELNWQECCVTSIQTLRSCNENFPASSDQNLQITNHSQSMPMSQTQADKFRRIDGICGLPEASQNRPRATKMVPKRKRINGDAHDCASTLDCVSLASC